MDSKSNKNSEKNNNNGANSGKILQKNGLPPTSSKPPMPPVKPPKGK